jgi:O-antigen ligase
MKGLLLTFVLAGGGSVIALARPFVGACVYCLFAVLRPQVMWSFSLPPDVAFSQYLAGATLLGWAVKGFPTGGRLRGTGSALLALAGLVVVTRLSAVWALSPRAGEIAWQLEKIVLMMVITFLLLDSERRVKTLAWVYLIAQGYLCVDLNITYVTSGQNIIVILDGYGALNNNTFALSLLPGIGLGIMMAIHEGGWRHRLLATASTLAAVHIVLLSNSRGGYLGLMMIAVVTLYLVPKSAKSLAMITAVLIGVSLVVGPPVKSRFATLFADELDDSAASRPELWGAAWNVMLEHPLLGLGPQGFGEVSLNYGFEPGKAVHNLYLQTGTDSGFPAFLLLMTFYALVLRLMWRSMRPLEGGGRTDPNALTSVMAGTVVGIVGYLTHSMFSAGLLIESPYIVAMLGLAAVRVHRGRSWLLASQPVGERPSPARVVPHAAR